MHKFAPIRYICPKRFKVLVPGLERVAVDHRSRRSVLFASKKNIFSSGSCSPQKKKNISLRPSPVRQSALTHIIVSAAKRGRRKRFNVWDVSGFILPHTLLSYLFFPCLTEIFIWAPESLCRCRQIGRKTILFFFESFKVSSQSVSILWLPREVGGGVVSTGNGNLCTKV